MPKCPKCASEKCKVLAAKPPDDPLIILVYCQDCGNRWEQWKPIDLELDEDVMR